MRSFPLVPAFRYWSRQRALGAITCLVLSGSMALSVAVYAILDGVWLRAVPYGDLAALVTVDRVDPLSGRSFAAARDYLRWKELGDTFEALGAFTQESMYVARSGESDPVRGIAASASLFSALLESAQQGRVFEASETDVVLLTSRGAGEQFSGTTVGETVTVNGRVSTVIGVLPPRFSEMIGGDLVVPLPARPNGTLKVIGRLKPGVSAAAATAAIAASDAHEESRPEWTSRVQPVRSLFVPPHVGRTLWLLFAIVILLQLVAAANASLLLTLATEAERRNVAVRLMLGASVAEIVREITLRGILLAGVATGAALLLVAWTKTALLSVIPPSIPRLKQVDLNAGVLVFSAVAASAIAIAMAYGPALVVSKTSPLEAFRSSYSRRQAFLTRAFIAAATGLACLIMIAAVSFAQSLHQLTTQPLGFSPEGIVAFGIDAPNAKPFDWRRHEPVRRAVLTELKQATEIAAFAGSDMPPFSGMGAAYSFRTLDAVAGPATHADVMIEHRRVTPNFFGVLGIPFVAGRDFDESDQPGTAPVAIVSELAARRFWPHTSPIGKRVALSSTEDPVTIIGIVADIRQAGFDREPIPMIYRPWLQEPRSGLILLVKPAGSVGTFLGAMNRQDRPVARSASIGRIRRIQDDMDRSVLQERFRAQLLLGFALTASLICAAGVTAVTAVTVVRARRDLAIRLSLGARIGCLVRDFTLRTSLLPIAAGITAAALAASICRPLLASILPDDMIFGGSTVTIASGLMLASGLISAAVTSGLMVRRTPLDLLRLE